MVGVLLIRLNRIGAGLLAACCGIITSVLFNESWLYIYDSPTITLYIIGLVTCICFIIGLVWTDEST